MDEDTKKFFEGLFLSIRTRMNQRFDRLDERFDRLERQLERIEVQIDKIGAGLPSFDIPGGVV